MVFGMVDEAVDDVVSTVSSLALLGWLRGGFERMFWKGLDMRGVFVVNRRKDGIIVIGSDCEREKRYRECRECKASIRLVIQRNGTSMCVICCGLEVGNFWGQPKTKSQKIKHEKVNC